MEIDSILIGVLLGLLLPFAFPKLVSALKNIRHREDEGE